MFSSSCTVYGEPDSVKEVNEKTPKQLPTSPYGYTKWMAEQIISDYAKAKSSFKVICLRYFNPIGAHPSGLIGELPITWNWLPDEFGENSNANLLHWTLGAPCFHEYSTAPMSSEWHRELIFASLCKQSDIQE